MNRIYRLVWNHALRVLQVASELSHTSGGGTAKGSSVRLSWHPAATSLAFALVLLGCVASPAAWGSPDEITLAHGAASGTSSTITCMTGDCQTPGIGPFNDAGTGTLTDGTLNAQLTTDSVTVTTSAGGMTSPGDTVVNLDSNTLILDSATYISLAGTFTGPGQLKLNFATTLDLATSPPAFAGGPTVLAKGNGSSTISALAQTWSLTGANQGSLGGLGVDFTGIANLDDSAGAVRFGAAGGVGGNITARSLDYSNYATAVTFDLSDSSGGTTGIGGTWSGVISVAGSSNSDTVRGTSQIYTLTGMNAGNNGGSIWSSFESVQDEGTGTLSAADQTWSLTGDNQGTVTNLAGGFSGIGNLVDTGTGHFIMHSGADGSISGDLDGGAGGSLDYTGYSSAVSVSLSGVGTTGVGGTISGISTLTANTDLDVSGSTSGALITTTTGAGTTTTLGSIVIGGNLAVTASGPVLQSGALRVSGNTKVDAGANAITLNDAGNVFGGTVNLAGGTTRITSSQPLALGALSTGALTLISSGALDMGHGSVGGTLTATSTDGPMTEATGGLQVTGLANLQAGTGAITLTDAANHFAGAVTVTGQSVSLRDAGDLQIASLNSGTNGKVSLIAGGTLTLPGVGIDTGAADLALIADGGSLATPGTLHGGNITLGGSGGLSLSDNVTSEGTLQLTSGNGTITQTGGSLTSGTLTGSSSGDTALAGINLISTLGDFSAANLSLTNAQTLTVSGNVNGGSSTALNTTAGDLAINASIGGTMTTLTSAGAISEGSGGSIDASSFGGSSVGSTTLNSANSIGQLGNFTAAGFSLVNARTLTVTGVLGGGANTTLTTTSGDVVINGAVSGSATALTSAGAISEGNGGSITASSFSGSSMGSTTLGGNNLIGTLSGFSAAGLDVTNAQTLTVGGTIDGGLSTSLTTTAGDLTINAAIRGATTTLTSAGAIIQGSSGLIDAGTLVGFSLGDTTLNGDNQIGALGNFSAANFSLSNTRPLNVIGTLAATNVDFRGGAGITITGALDATGGVTLGTTTGLQVGNGGSTGVITGNVIDNGSLVFNRSDELTFTGVISGSGTLTQQGSGVLTLDGDSSGFSGNTRVAAGSLLIGSAAGPGITLSGDVAVDGGGSLGGHGIIGGNVTLASGGHLAPGNSMGTLTVVGDLTVTQGGVLDYEFGLPGANFGTFGESDRTMVGGDLALNGAVLNITDIGGFGPGTYNLFTYGGTLSETHGGISIGTTPGGVYTIQTLTGSRQVNLINATGLSLNFWNANGQASSTVSGGGDGIWSTSAPVWTDASGNVTLAMQPQPGFAIFAGTPGIVTVDDTSAAVSANGLQFATDGYTLDGDTLTLVSASAGNMPIIRVGDGSSAGASMTATVSAVIAGTDGLAKTELGTLILTGANTYTGGTTISGGTLQGNTTSLHGNITDNAMLAFDQATDGTFAGVVSGNGALTKLGTGTLTLTGANSYSGGTTISAGTLRGNAASLQGNINDQAALVIDQASDGVFAGSVSGQGTITKLGGGTLTVNTVNTFSGSTTVQAGKLVVGDDSHASATLGGLVTVSSGATLGGIGTLGALDLAGTVALSHSFGTLHVTGDVTFRPGSSYQIEATPDGHANAIVANGKVSILGGSALVLAQNGDWAPRTDYTILTGAQGISGQFATASSSLTFLHPVLSYSANAINLSLQRNAMSFASVARTSNQRATAAAADQLSFANPAYSALTTVDVATARHAFDQLSGVIHASTSSALIDDSRHVRDTINRHLLGIRNDETECRTTGDGSVWTSAWGHGGHHDGDGNAALMQSNGSGLLVGADLDFGSEGRVGAVIGHGQSSIQSASVGSSAHVLGDQAGLYASGTFDAFVLRGGAVYAWQNVTTHRTVAFGSFADQLRGKHHARTAQAYVEGGYRFDLGHAQQLEPFVNLARIHVRQDGVREGGGGAALVVTGNSASMSTATLGLRDTFALDTASTVHGHASLGWQQSWGDLTPVSSMHFASGNTRFAISGVPVARHAVATDLGVDFKLAKNVSVDTSYLGQFGSGVKDQGARMSLTVTF